MISVRACACECLGASNAAHAGVFAGVRHTRFNGEDTVFSFKSRFADAVAIGPVVHAGSIVEAGVGRAGVIDEFAGFTFKALKAFADEVLVVDGFTIATVETRVRRTWVHLVFAVTAFKSGFADTLDVVSNLFALATVEAGAGIAQVHIQFADDAFISLVAIADKSVAVFDAGATVLTGVRSTGPGHILAVFAIKSLWADAVGFLCIICADTAILAGVGFTFVGLDLAVDSGPSLVTVTTEVGPNAATCSPIKTGIVGAGIGDIGTGVTTISRGAVTTVVREFINACALIQTGIW